MTEREEYEAWFAREFDGREIPEQIRALGFAFWRACRQSLATISGELPEIRIVRADQ